MKKTTILLADDHPLFRAGVKQALSAHESFDIIAEAENGNEALDKITELNPDVAILDIRMPLKSGLKVLANINENECPTKVILLTMHKNPNYFYKAISLGVKGYVLKEVAVAEIANAVNTVIHGNSYISGTLSKLLLEKERSSEEIDKNVAALSSLTTMEREVLKLVAEWKSNVEIADKLFISPRTAGNHRSNISNKLNLRGLHSIIQFAIENRELF